MSSGASRIYSGGQTSPGGQVLGRVKRESRLFGTKFSDDDSRGDTYLALVPQYFPPQVISNPSALILAQIIINLCPHIYGSSLTNLAASTLSPHTTIPP